MPVESVPGKVLMYRNGFKRMGDIVLAALLLAALSPVLFVVAWMVRRNLGSPVLFRQKRPGRHGKIFEMLKFRSMRDAVGKDGQPLPDAERLTPFGQWLRSTSLDELPELWNILRGDMSFVGPRPLLVQYLPRYSPEQARRHEVRPGLTGWAQVNGRNALDWESRFRLDVWYVDHLSLWIDFKIALMTVGKVLRRDGVSAEGQATCCEFMGSIDTCPVEVLGAGGHAKVVVGNLLSTGREVVACRDDRPGLWGGEVLGVPIASGGMESPHVVGRAYVIGIGSNEVRQRLANTLAGPWTRAIHRDAMVSPDVSIGEGTVIMAGACVQPGVKIGVHCVVNTQAVVDHDVVLGDFAFVGPHATLCGNVSVGAKAMIGAGATLLPGVVVGDGAIVGAGAVVVLHVEAGDTVVGIPAKPHQRTTRWDETITAAAS